MDDWVLWMIAAVALAVGEILTVDFFLGPIAIAAFVAAIVAVIGAKALVLEQVDVHHGSVKIGGEIWTARTYDEDEVLEPGARVEVMKIEGATALVAK